MQIENLLIKLFVINIYDIASAHLTPFCGGAMKCNPQLKRVYQYNQRRGEKYPAKTRHRADACAHQWPYHVSQIHKRLVIPENTTGNVIAGIFQQQRLYGGQHRAIGKTKQKTQYAKLHRRGDERHRKKQHHGNDQRRH